MIAGRQDGKREREMINQQTIQPVYSKYFFDSCTGGSLQSARVVIPILLKLVKVSSVIDVGCGRGAWLRVFQENGVGVIRGLDGHYVDNSTLLVDASCFTAVDLCEPFKIDQHYDLAVCLEVAEHLPTDVGPLLISQLTSAAPLVLFSAAIPGQSGTSHVNEQWPAYWKRLFSEHGYRRLDPIRRRVYHDSRVEWWYRQNVFLFASDYRIKESASLQAEEKLANDWELEIIHKDILKAIVAENANLSYQLNSIRALLRALPKAAIQAVCRRFGKP